MGELLAFMRPRISLTAAVVAVFGFMLFNGIDARALLVFAAAFFGTAFAYSYNSVTDVVEDAANKKKNSFAYSRSGKAFSFFLAVVGGVFAARLGAQPSLFYLLTITVSFVYSFFRVKRFYPWKSVYVGFGYTTVFLFGASAAPLAVGMFVYYFAISCVIFAMGTIADLRDYAGDFAARVPTLPVRLGEEKAKLVVYWSLAIAAFLIACLWLSELFAVIPFAMAAVLLLRKGAHPQIAHNYMRAGVLLMPILTVISSVWR